MGTSSSYLARWKVDIFFLDSKLQFLTGMMPCIVWFSECGWLCLIFLNVGCDYYKININREHCIILASGFHDKLCADKTCDEDLLPRSPVMVYKKKEICMHRNRSEWNFIQVSGPSTCAWNFYSFTPTSLTLHMFYCSSCL